MAKKAARKDAMQTRRRAVPPDPCEWDFREIQDWELPFVTIYEYARSNPISTHLVSWFSSPCETRDPWPYIKIDSEQVARAKWKLKKPLPDTMGEVIEYIFDDAPTDQALQTALKLIVADIPRELAGPGVHDIALRFPRFPEPWMQTRQRRGPEYLKKRCFLNPQPRRVLRELWDPLEWNPNNPLRDLHATSSLSACMAVHEFLVDWSAPAIQIEKSFKSWLKRRHPGRARGRRHRLELLKWLATHRLKTAGMSHTVANDLIVARRRVPAPVNGPELPYYTNEKKWYAAARKAEALLNRPDFEAEILRCHGLLWAS